MIVVFEGVWCSMSILCEGEGGWFFSYNINKRRVGRIVVVMELGELPKCLG